jgi:hypothetical protein
MDNEKAFAPSDGSWAKVISSLLYSDVEEWIRLRGNIIIEQLAVEQSRSDQSNTNDDLQLDLQLLLLALNASNVLVFML